MKILDKLPTGFFDVKASELYSIVDGPSLIHLKGKEARPVFLSILLHGNETSGLDVVQTFLKQYEEKELPRSVSLFLGNVEAARYNERLLDGQLDYNRVWKGGDREEHKMMRKIIEEMKELDVFLSIDIHNNTGSNPYYGCVNLVEPNYLYLASLFGDTIIYFTNPDSVQSMAFSKMCPATTIECGKPGDVEGIKHSVRFLEKCINLDALDAEDFALDKVKVFHTVAKITVPSNASIEFSDERTDADFTFLTNYDSINFTEIDENTLLGFINNEVRLVAENNDGDDVTGSFFDYKDGEIRAKCTIIPSMFTKNKKVIFQDCLGYIMQRYHL